MTDFLLMSLSLAVASAPSPSVQPQIQGVTPAFMDRSVNACRDFYGFANGAYEKEPIPAAYAAYGVNQEIDDRNWTLLKTILEESRAVADAKPNTPVQRIGDFYASGMDEAGIETAGLDPLRPFLEKIDALSKPEELAPLLADLHRHGVGAGFGFFVGVDDKDATAMTAQFYQGGLGLPERDYYLRTDAASKRTLRQYESHIARMLELSGVDAAAAKKDATRIVALETKLARASRTLEALRDPQKNYNKVAIANLKKMAPRLDWNAYLTALSLPESEKTVLVGQPEFFKTLGELTRSTSISDWKRYLRWHLISDLADALPAAIDVAHFEFYGKTLSGATEQLPRWKRILRAADHAIGFDLGQRYVEKAFSPTAKTRVKSMIDWHVKALRISIQTNSWMSPETKTQALRKLDTLTAKVGYPDVWRDYSQLQISRRPHVLNVLAGRLFEFDRQLTKLGKPVDRSEWAMTPQTNNAYYNPSFNEICLPAGILQPPFFDEKADDASNYGALASTIGHEILHGFDDQGSQYDADGNLKNWWTLADRKAYDDRTRGVVGFYNTYEPLPGLKIRGQQTLGENLADIGGLKISYEAWKLATAGKPQTAKDELTPEQRFFVAFAQGWRTNQRPEQIRLQVTSDVHSPVRQRVLGSVALVRAFHEAYGCSNDQSLNLW